jgi:hypothetical protein
MMLVALTGECLNKLFWVMECSGVCRVSGCQLLAVATDCCR